MARRRNKLALMVILLLLFGMAAGGLLFETVPPGDDAQLVAPTPVPVLAPAPEPAAAQPPASPKPAPARPRAPPPQRYLVKESRKPLPGITLKLMETLALPVVALAVENDTSDMAVTAGTAPSSTDKPYLVFVNQCTEHEHGGADYRKCRTREIRRLAFGCTFYQGEVKRVAYERRAEAEGWMAAYCRKADAYRASAN